jgi:recombination protein RecA
VNTLTKTEKFNLVKATGITLDKQFETTTFQRQGNLVHKPVPHIPTNLPSLDYEVFGCGGAPRGRIIEIFGPEAAGKTAVALYIIGECQKAGGVAAFVDAEHGLSPTFAHTLGVDMDELVISQPDYGEQALEIVDALVENKAVDLIVVDSVSALVPKAELDGEMGDSHMGLQARLMSQALRKLTGAAAKSDVTIIFINQIREKIGMVFGNPEVTTGGRALKFYSSVRLEVRRLAASSGGTLKLGDVVIGHKVHIKGVKNKVAMPFRETDIELDYQYGFNRADDTINLAQKLGVLTGSAWLVLNDKLGSKFRRVDLLRSDLQALLLERIALRYAEEKVKAIHAWEEANEKK